MGTKDSKTIFKIFLGLLFSFCFINLYSINVITAFIGILLLCGALYELKNETSPFRKAFIFSLIQLGVQTVNIILQFASDNFKYIFEGIGAVLLAFIVYNIYDGLRIILLNCDTYSRVPLVWALPLYIITVLLRTATLMFSDNSILRYITIGVCAVIYISLLAMIIKTGLIIKKSDYYMNKDRLKFLYFVPVLLIAVIAGSGYLLINGLNSGSVNSIEYIQQDTDNTEAAAQIRKEMSNSGFPLMVIKNLPDSEIMKYSGIFRATSHTEELDIDGGKIVITAVTSYMDLGEVRFLQYFEWKNPPAGKFVDLIGLCIETKKVVMLPDAPFDGLVLYDKDGITYKTDYTDKDIALKYPKAKYKVMPSAKNLRGYLAINTNLAQSSSPADFNTSIVYAHQKNIFNFPYADSFTFFRLGRQTAANKAVFDTYILPVNESYIPKNYQPDENTEPADDQSGQEAESSQPAA